MSSIPVGGGGGSVSSKWGDITGDIANQIDLETALNDKFDTSDIASGEDIEAQTAGKVIDASSVVADDITLAGNSKQKLISEFSAKGYIDNKVSGVYRPAGDWDASSGSFPTGAILGDTYYVNVAGTVDRVSFSVGDKLFARINNPSTTVFINNWDKFDNNDDVVSVHGRTGSVVSANGDYNASQITNTPSGTILATNLQDAINELDSVVSNKIGTSNYIDIGNVRIMWGSGNTSPTTVHYLVRYPAGGFSSAPSVVASVSEGNFKNLICYNINSSNFRIAGLVNDTNTFVATNFNWQAIGLKP